MNGFMTLLIGIVIGYHLRPLLTEWKRRRRQRKFRPEALKPYRPKRP